MFTIKSIDEINVLSGSKLNVLQIVFEDDYLNYKETTVYKLLAGDNKFILAEIESNKKEFDEKSEEFIKLDTLRDSILKELVDYETRAVLSESRHFKINRKFELERINL